jgi:hypothetical protein
LAPFKAPTLCLLDTLKQEIAFPRCWKLLASMSLLNSRVTKKEGVSWQDPITLRTRSLFRHLSLSQPLVFIEGNHRIGLLIADWISVYHGFAPFVLSADNAIVYFAPSTEIKSFADKSTWRGQARLPKYRKSFFSFWEQHIDSRYLIQTEA